MFNKATPKIVDQRIFAAGVATLALLLSACSAGSSAAVSVESMAPPAAHVHGISVEAMSGRVLLATHEGLYDVTRKPAVKIGPTIDLMGFTPTSDPKVFYASGHPGTGSALSNPVGLIKSIDGGVSWQPVSRQGESDFHALTYSRGGLIGFDGALRTSTDGKKWSTTTTSFAPAVLAASPGSPDVLATTEQGVQRSPDGGKTWQLNAAAPVIQFAAFATAAEVAGVSPAGAVYTSSDAGRTWTATGQVPGQVEAIAAIEGSPGKPWIWAATDTGVQVSTDGGATFHPAIAS
ncbi:exo-alpha-sialidase [Paenarthrobacter sp. Z7-10]|uniref:F510_1955 family glycosylhydrolase n=1 Tax=Paenarthrobacter sp. Z7-10 TaxID=2787635 RepID=UPI0022A962AD|nr:exo-alpha-sialidase [Paenarthrobacter sp. Z7-10]MCZ2403900.1 exo-alpha-sialidase [Paenarthrobacter sp. Z7-10]